ncbi:MAG: (Fe-S)-binding protein [Bacteroidota bacterium]|nr:(Fe-S)-binding protein [Bacteroidota bacterium]
MENQKKQIKVPVMAEVFEAGNKPEFLFWVGCAGAFDDRYKKVTRAFAKILDYLKVSYACLGPEETCTGDPARRAGNEMLFQMQAMTNIETFEMYEVQKIIAICPHCYNTFKNDYPDLGGNYEVIHHTQFLQNMIESGKLRIDSDIFKDKTITFHDPCYLGRSNDEYDAPRFVLNSIPSTNIELKRNKSNALCCGAGGAQMFKEAEKGDKEIYTERTEEVIDSGADIVATACPFCMVMLTDGIKYQDKDEEIKNLDIAEIISTALEL